MRKRYSGIQVKYSGCADTVSSRRSWRGTLLLGIHPSWQGRSAGPAATGELARRNLGPQLHCLPARPRHCTSLALEHPLLYLLRRHESSSCAQQQHIRNNGQPNPRRCHGQVRAAPRLPPQSPAPLCSSRDMEPTTPRPASSPPSLTISLQWHGVFQARFVILFWALPWLLAVAQLTGHSPRFRRQRLSLLRVPDSDCDQGSCGRRRLGFRPPRRREQAVLSYRRSRPDGPPFGKAWD